jgi:hypothetical protein
MALLPSAFKTQGKEEMGDFTAIPAGEYLAKIIKSEMKLTSKAKDAEDPSIGQMLALQFEVIGPTQKGRMFFRNLNLVNESQTAVEIAEKELTSICKAVGLSVIQDSAELHGKPMMCKLIVKGPSDKEKKQGYTDAKNEVRSYKPADGSVGASSSGTGDKPAKKKLF